MDSLNEGEDSAKFSPDIIHLKPGIWAKLVNLASAYWKKKKKKSQYLEVLNKNKNTLVVLEP